MPLRSETATSNRVHPVAWPVAELSAVRLAANGIKSVQTSAAGVTLVDQTG